MEDNEEKKNNDAPEAKKKNCRRKQDVKEKKPEKTDQERHSISVSKNPVIYFNE